MQDRIISSAGQRRVTFAEFLAFTRDRPDGEKWELFDGEMVLQASANNRHQTIVANVTALLKQVEWQTEASWAVLPGLGVHDQTAPDSATIPDVIVRPRSMGTENFCDDLIVAFEVLSPSTRKRDLEWKRRYYTSLPAPQAYVVIDTKKCLVRLYARAAGWKELRLDHADAALELPMLGAALKLSDIYRDTGLST